MAEMKPLPTGSSKQEEIDYLGDICVVLGSGTRLSYLITPNLVKWFSGGIKLFPI